MKNRARRLARAAWPWALAIASGASAQEGGSAPTSARVESIARPDGGATPGRVVGDAAAGFRFEPSGGGAAVPLEAAGVVTFDGPPGGAGAGSPPVRVELGLDQRVSGRLGRADEATIELLDGPGGAPVAIRRGGASALAQRPGEVVAAREGFEAIDPARWATIGEAEAEAGPHVEGERALALPARGAAATLALNPPVGSGRLEVAFLDPGGSAPGHQWFVDLLFRGPQGPETVRVVLDAGEESLGVQSTGGPALAVQRLARRPGWRRLAVRFGAETEIAVDGDELAHGRAGGGPLAEVRLAHQPVGTPVDTSLVVRFDDLRVARLAEPVGNLEVAPTVDDVRLVDGDQIFGRFRSADPDAVRLAVDNRVVPLPWTEVAAVQFRREPLQGRPVAGLLARVEWRAGPGADARDLDQIEGAILALTDAALTVATPYAGDLTIPRDRLRRLKVTGRGDRIVVDPHAHHLGNNLATPDLPLDPPMHEGGTLERTLTLDRAPDPRAPAFVVLDVVQVIGEESGDPFFAGLVKKGQLRTVARVNGTVVDYLNRHVATKNEAPERIRLPIPPASSAPGPTRSGSSRAASRATPTSSTTSAS